jgi:hypothetical protein
MIPRQVLRDDIPAGLAGFDHASCYSSNQSLAGLIKEAVNLIQHRAEKNLNVL